MRKLLMAMMLAGLAAAAFADVSFSYSGQLRNETGGPVAENDVKITFSLYNAATGGAALWSRMIPVLLDDNGYFAVELSNASGSAVGAETSLETVLAQNATLYIGLNVDGSSGEISPRQKLLSTPHAAFAQDVQEAKRGFTVNGAATFMSGLQIGAGMSPKAQITTDGELVAQKLTVPKIDGDVSVGGSFSATKVKQDGNILIPKGVVVMWAGTQATVPAGWALCDGKNGTPDLRGRFIVGSGKSSDGTTDYCFKDTGGKEVMTLTTDQMPSHNHQPGSFWMRSGYYCPDDKGGYRKDNPAWPSINGDISEGDWNEYFVTDNTGGGKAHENRPPYYALAYIMKL